MVEVIVIVGVFVWVVVMGCGIVLGLLFLGVHEGVAGVLWY